jgi:hypothetical protein
MGDKTGQTFVRLHPRKFGIIIAIKLKLKN